MKLSFYLWFVYEFIAKFFKRCLFLELITFFLFHSQPIHIISTRNRSKGKGTLTFDEFCRVAVHFSEEDDEALQ